MRRITIETRTHDYHVHIDNDRGKWACGKTIDDAIGNLVRTHREALGIEIIDETKGKRPFQH